MRKSGLQLPEPGDVINYSYLWRHEYEQGRDATSWLTERQGLQLRRITREPLSMGARLILSKPDWSEAAGGIEGGCASASSQVKRQCLDKLVRTVKGAPVHHPLRLMIDRSAIQSNWRWLAGRAGVPAGAAVKADGYGLGARETLEALLEAGCRDFFVSTWAEAEALGHVPQGLSLVVLHGVGPDDAENALRVPARPCLNTPEQVARWKAIAPLRPCDVMVDTGMNRLGLRPAEIDALDGLAIDTLHSHLACADEDHPLNEMQLERFRAVVSAVPARRYSLANSAGICLGRDYSFDLVRPGLSLYGGVPREEAAGNIGQVVRVQAQIVQRRTIPEGETCGYGATFVAKEDTAAAVLNIGYADGYLQGFSSHGVAFAGEYALPVLGRVSMDLIALGADAAPGLREGDWVELDYDLPSASKQSGLSQYELLTTLGARFERRWI